MAKQSAYFSCAMIMINNEFYFMSRLVQQKTFPTTNSAASALLDVKLCILLHRHSVCPPQITIAMGKISALLRTIKM